MVEACYNSARINSSYNWNLCRRRIQHKEEIPTGGRNVYHHLRDLSPDEGVCGSGYTIHLKPLQVCNIKVIHAAVNILMGVLIRDVFPDPDVLCHHLKYYQFEVVHWFCELVMVSLQNAKVNHSESRAACTREELVCSI